MRSSTLCPDWGLMLYRQAAAECSGQDAGQNVTQQAASAVEQEIAHEPGRLLTCLPGQAQGEHPHNAAAHAHAVQGAKQAYEKSG